MRTKQIKDMLATFPEAQNVVTIIVRPQCLIVNRVVHFNVTTGSSTHMYSIKVGTYNEPSPSMDEIYDVVSSEYTRRNTKEVEVIEDGK